MMIALVGNQNCGKTTLFNVLTGSSQHVGNFPGVTVDQKVGIYKGKKEEVIEICDLPGIYSLSPYTTEEIVTRDFIIKQKPDAILNIIDATNIERNLYLTMQLCELNIPIVIAISMMDEMTASGNSVNVEKLSKYLGVPCVPIIASKNEGIEEVMNKTILFGKKRILPTVKDICKEDSPVHRAIHGVIHLISDHAEERKLPARYIATHLIEGDELILNELGLTDNEKDMIEHIIKEMETDTGYDKEVSLAMMRYEFIDGVSEDCIKRKNEQTREQIRSNKIDKVLTNKYLAFPLFILIMGLVFLITFGLVGGLLTDVLENGINYLINLLSTSLTEFGTNPVVISLLCDGLLTGVGSVLVFLPVIVCLFFFLSLLEDSGYMARVAFIMDKPLRKIGLSGRSFVPMLIGFGCSVPAVMSTRTLSSEKDKKLTLTLIPFMPCSAKLPIFTVLCAAFFKAPVWIIILIYFLSIALGILTGFIIHVITKSKAMPFMMELPSYRIPTGKTTLLLMWEKAKDFLKKAFSIILIAAIVVWFLSSFDYKINYVTDNSKSLLAYIAKGITIIFRPMGVERWEVTAAIITGLSAKESVVSTLAILVGEINFSSLMNGLQAFSLLMFATLYMPCIATFSVLIKELKSPWKATLYMLFQTGIAYVVAVLIYQVGAIWF